MTDLTPRQRDLLELVAAGRSNPEIAKELGITRQGVSFHLTRIYARLDVRSRAEAVQKIGKELPAKVVPSKSPVRRPPLLSDEQCVELGRRYQGGVPLADLLRVFGISRNTAYLALERAGVPRTNVRPPRTRRLSEAELELARRRGVTSWDAAPRPPVKAHRIEDISYRREWVLCTCGVEITAPRDDLEPERHQPLVDAWQAHRRAVGARVLSVAQEASFHRAYS